MASNPNSDVSLQPRAMPSNLEEDYGLQPNSDSLQTTSDGLQPT